jgi:hypothetical protein
MTVGEIGAILEEARAHARHLGHDDLAEMLDDAALLAVSRQHERQGRARGRFAFEQPANEG